MAKLTRNRNWIVFTMFLCMFAVIIMIVVFYEMPTDAGAVDAPPIDLPADSTGAESVQYEERITSLNSMVLALQEELTEKNRMIAEKDSIIIAQNTADTNDGDALSAIRDDYAELEDKYYKVLSKNYRVLIYTVDDMREVGRELKQILEQEFAYTSVDLRSENSISQNRMSCSDDGETRTLKTAISETLPSRLARLSTFINANPCIGTQSPETITFFIHSL